MRRQGARHQVGETTLSEIGDRRDHVPADPARGTDRRAFLKAAGLAGIAGAFAGTAAHASSGIGTIAQTQPPATPA
jgi:hypothetical protein